MSIGKKEEEKLIVFKATRLIDARSRLSHMAQRVYGLAIARLRPGGDANRYVRFRVKEFAQLLETKSEGKIYEALRAVAEELVNRPVRIPKFERGAPPSTDGWLLTRLAASAELLPGEGVFELEFSGKLTPFLFQIQKHYTTYEYEQAVKMSSKHAYRLFELAMSWRGYHEKDGSHKPWEIQLRAFRELLGVEVKEYPRYADFRRRVLDPACQQIAEHSDYQIAYTAVKKGRGISGLRFVLTHKQPPAPILHLSLEPAPSTAYVEPCDPEAVARFTSERAKQKDRQLGLPYSE